MTAGERVLAAALELVGVRFRPQGRDPALGLDCVGVVAVALERAGARVMLPRAYALASGCVPPGAVPCAVQGGVRPCDGSMAGDVLLCRISAAQLHLVVRGHDGIVHADAQARRVVARPGAVPWPVEAAWRLTGRSRGGG